MIIANEKELIDFGRKIGEQIKKDFAKNPRTVVIELVGDVGAGKTTFTRGLAEGLGIKEPITSPSFTICKKYALPVRGILAHYDFYRLDDPGIMSEELMETIAEPHNVAVIEWGKSVEDILPPDHVVFQIKMMDDGTRQIIREERK